MSDSFIQKLRSNDKLKTGMRIHICDVFDFIQFFTNKELSDEQMSVLSKELRRDNTLPDYITFGTRFINNQLVENSKLLADFPSLKYLQDSIWRVIQPQFNHFTQYRFVETNKDKGRDNVFINCTEVKHHVKHLDGLKMSDFLVLLDCFDIKLYEVKDYTLAYHIRLTNDKLPKYVIHEDTIDVALYKLERFVKEAINNVKEQKMLNIQRMLQKQMMGE